MGNTATQRAETDSPDFLKKIGKISNQSAVFLMGNLFLVAAGWLFRVYVARTIGAAALGIFTLGMTAVNFFGAFATLGLPTTLARFIPFFSARKEYGRIRRLIWYSLLLFLGLNVVLAILMMTAQNWISTRLYNEPLLTRYIPLFAGILVLTQLTTFLGEALRGYQEVARRTVVTTFLRFVVRAIVTVPLFVVGYKITGYIAGEFTSVVVTTALLAFFVWKLTPNPPSSAVEENTRTFDRQVMVFSSSMIGMELLSFVSLQLDKVLVGVYLTSTDVGVYSVVIAIASYLSTVLLAVNSILGPIIAELYAKKALDLLGKIFKTLTKWMLGLTWPVAVVMVLYSNPILHIFGKEFQSGSWALVFLVIGGIINVGTGSVGNMLIMSGNERWEVFANLINAVLMVPLYLVLIPPMGIIGAAIATGVGTTVVNLIRLWFVKRRLGLLPYDWEFAKIIPSLIAPVVLLYFMRQWFSYLGNVKLVLLATFAGYLSMFAVAAIFGASAEDKAILVEGVRSLKHGFNKASFAQRFMMRVQPQPDQE